jgi:hypothetical protein
METYPWLFLGSRVLTLHRRRHHQGHHLNHRHRQTMEVVAAMTMKEVAAMSPLAMMNSIRPRAMMRLMTTDWAIWMDQVVLMMTHLLHLMADLAVAAVDVQGEGQSEEWEEEPPARITEAALPVHPVGPAPVAMVPALEVAAAAAAVVTMAAAAAAAKLMQGLELSTWMLMAVLLRFMTLCGAVTHSGN